MPQKSEVGPTNIADILGKIADKDYSVNFDVTLEFNTPNLRVGSLRVHGRLESVATKKR